jgi:hypothetical protein
VHDTDDDDVYPCMTQDECRDIDDRLDIATRRGLFTQNPLQGDFKVPIIPSFSAMTDDEILRIIDNLPDVPHTALLRHLATRLEDLREDDESADSEVRRLTASLDNAEWEIESLRDRVADREATIYALEASLYELENKA